MSVPGRYGENENLTLSEADLASRHGAPKPVGGGARLRAYCPVHGSDNQRSLGVDLATGRFFCHNCRAWGYMDWARERHRDEREAGRSPRPGPQRGRGPRSPVPRRPEVAAAPESVEPVREDLSELLSGFGVALAGSWGEEYLKRRGIPTALARSHGVGYAAHGSWPHRGRDWRYGRLVLPHTRPDGTVVNLYGRAVGSDEKVPKGIRHDHLAGQKGYFNAAALRGGDGPLFVCEGAFDALAIMASGRERAVAIFGVSGWRWDWVSKDVRRIVFAMDADDAGREGWTKIGREARLRGIRVAYLGADNYGGCKDAAAAWSTGKLRIGEWPEDGGAGQSPNENIEHPRRPDVGSRRRAEVEAALAKAREEVRLDVALVPEPRVGDGDGSRGASAGSPRSSDELPPPADELLRRIGELRHREEKLPGGDDPAQPAAVPTNNRALRRAVLAALADDARPRERFERACRKGLFGLREEAEAFRAVLPARLRHQGRREALEETLHELALALLPSSLAASRARLRSIIHARSRGRDGGGVSQQRSPAVVAIQDLLVSDPRYFKELALLAMSPPNYCYLREVAAAFRLEIVRDGREVEGGECFTDGLWIVMRELFPASPGAAWDREWAEGLMRSARRYVAERDGEEANPAWLHEEAEIAGAAEAEDRVRYRAAVRAWACARPRASGEAQGDGKV